MAFLSRASFRSCVCVKTIEPDRPRRDRRTMLKPYAKMHKLVNKCDKLVNKPPKFQQNDKVDAIFVKSVIVP